MHHPEQCDALNLIRAQRSLCDQLRFGILALSLETGRLHLVAQADKRSLMCGLDEVGNEKHFVFYCPFHRELQVKRFQKMVDGNSSMLDMSDECRLQYQYTHSIGRTFYIAQFLLDAHHQCMRALCIL